MFEIVTELSFIVGVGVFDGLEFRKTSQELPVDEL
jgi:hypothetical protein